jgi:hypothetical protein
VNRLQRLLTDRKFRLARLWSNEELRRLGGAFTGRAINVSAWKDEDKDGGHYRTYFPNVDHYHISNFSGHRGYQGLQEEVLLDLTAELPEELEGAFDLVFNHTTLEHIYEVEKAFDNLCKMTSDALVVIVPFAQVQHESDSWKDYWRFTPTWAEEAMKRRGLTMIYVSANNHRNAATYVVAVGVRDPEAWANRLPTPPRREDAARWLGESILRRVAARAVRRVGVRI